MQVPLLVNDFLRRAADVYPEKLAIVDGERRYTYRDFQARVNQLSRGLHGFSSCSGLEKNAGSVHSSFWAHLRWPRGESVTPSFDGEGLRLQPRVSSKYAPVGVRHLDVREREGRGS